MGTSNIFNYSFDRHVKSDFYFYHYLNLAISEVAVFFVGEYDATHCEERGMETPNARVVNRFPSFYSLGGCTGRHFRNRGVSGV